MTLAASRTALVLVDLQRDYADKPGIVPDVDVVAAAARELLAGFRDASAPIAHVHTIVRPDGADAMPHRRGAARGFCVAGTPGATPLVGLEPGEHEFVARKQYFDGFGDPGLDSWLRTRDVGEVVVAGLFTHACVRETALGAYQRGYRVVIAADAVGSDQPEHAAHTRVWLQERASPFVGNTDIIARLHSAATGPGARAPQS